MSLLQRNSQKKPLHYFMLGVLFWFPLCFFIWYIAAQYHLAPIVWLSDIILQHYLSDAVMWLRLDHHTLILASNFGENELGQVVSPPVGDDILGFHLNPLIYAYSLPLLYALILATPQAHKWYRLLVGTLLLLPTELLSMLSSLLKTLSFDVGLAFQQQQQLSGLELEFIALAYQVGTLIIPMVAPLVIWVALHRDFLLQLAPQLVLHLNRPSNI
ncbi:MAG: exosortase H-associated membrane protein [bacterium]